MPFDPDAYLASKQDHKPTGFDPDAYLASKSSPMVPMRGGKTAPMISQEDRDAVPGLIQTGMKALDSVTGAPARSAISAAQNSDQPSDIPSDAWKAAKSQFGNMDQEAPTGQDIVEKAGVPQGVASKVAGFGMDMAANPLNLAGPLAGLAGKATESLAPVAETLSKLANEKALKAAGAMTKDLRNINDKGLQDTLGSYLLDKKIVKPLSTVSGIANKLAEAETTAGEQIGSILENADAAGASRINAKDLAVKLSQDPEISGLRSEFGGQRTAERIEKYLEDLSRQGEGLTLKDAQKLRQKIDKEINFNKPINEQRDVVPYLYKMRTAVRDAMNDSVNALPSTPEIDQLKTANSNYNKLSTLRDIADDNKSRITAHRTFGLPEFIVGGAAMTTGHAPIETAIKTGSAIAASKLGRTFGNPVMATSAKLGSNALNAAPKALGAVPKSAGLIPSASQAGLLKKGNKK